MVGTGGGAIVTHPRVTGSLGVPPPTRANARRLVRGRASSPRTGGRSQVSAERATAREAAHHAPNAQVLGRGVAAGDPETSNQAAQGVDPLARVGRRGSHRPGSAPAIAGRFARRAPSTPPQLRGTWSSRGRRALPRGNGTATAATDGTHFGVRAAARCRPRARARWRPRTIGTQATRWVTIAPPLGAPPRGAPGHDPAAGWVTLRAPLKGARAARRDRAPGDGRSRAVAP